MAKPELGLKRLCPNCGTKYYDLNRDPIVCPKCNALFATGAIAVRRAAAADEDEEDTDLDDEGVELVALEEAVEDDAEVPDDALPGVTDEVVDADDDALIDEVDDSDDEVADVVRGEGEDDEER